MSKTTPEQVRRLAEQGMTRPEAAKQLGLNISSVIGYERRHGIEFRKTRKAPEPVKKVAFGEQIKFSAARAIAEKKNREVEQGKIRDIAVANGIQPNDCRVHLMTPIEALDYKLKRPWQSKVSPVEPKDLTCSLYDQLVQYDGGFSNQEIADLFGFKNAAAFNVWLKKWGYIDSVDRDLDDLEKKLIAIEEKPHKPTTEEINEMFDSEPKSLEETILQAARELGGRFPFAGLSLGLLVEAKQKQYGDMISAMGPLLKVLYPNQIKPEQYDDLALIIRICDKLGRITRGNGEGGEDAWGDIAGYGLLGQQRG